MTRRYCRECEQFEFRQAYPVEQEPATRTDFALFALTAVVMTVAGYLAFTALLLWAA